MSGRILHQIEDVVPLQRIATREDKYGHLHGGNFIDQVLGFGGSQLARVSQRSSGGATVCASQVARLGSFPYGEERTLFEVGIPCQKSSHPTMGKTSNT